VHFVGAARGADKVWLLQNSRFVVAPSRTWESFGLVVLESYAAGRPVIASALPGMMDLVEPGRTGLVVPPESPASLAQAIDMLLADEATTDQYGLHARGVAAAFDWHSIAERHLELYGHLVGAPALRKAA